LEVVVSIFVPPLETMTSADFEDKEDKKEREREGFKKNKSERARKRSLQFVSGLRRQKKGGYIIFIFL
jgi:hypothetical protein